MLHTRRASADGLLELDRLTVVPTVLEAARIAAERVAKACVSSFGAVVTLPTGTTWEPVYAQLRRMKLPWSATTVVQLDEYVPVSGSVSLGAWLSERLIGPCGVGRFIEIPQPGGAAPVESFDQTLRALGGVDLAGLGLGHNGHIAFNEPGSSCRSRTRRVRLDPVTRDRNGDYWAGALVPAAAVTQGVATLMEARELLLVVTGKGKAQPVARALEGPICSEYPVSMLRTHPRLHVIVDASAASNLKICRPSIHSGFRG